MTRINSKLLWTHEDWIDKAKKSEPDLMGCEIPFIHASYNHDFAPSINEDRTFSQYVRDVSYDEKIALFHSVGFKVLFMTLDLMKVNTMVKKTDHNGLSLNQQFIDKDRNVFIVCVDNLDNELYFVCEYDKVDEALADFTVDYEKVKADNERRAKTRNMMAKWREKSKNDTDSGIDFPQF